MILSETNEMQKEDNTSSSSNENEFRELDNEIEKVVRGEGLYEEDKPEKNISEKKTNDSNISQNKIKDIQNFTNSISIKNKNKNSNSKTDRKNTRNNLNNTKFNNRLPKSSKNNLNNLIKSKKPVVDTINNFKNGFLNNINIHFNKNYSNNYNNNSIQEMFDENINNNQNINKIMNPCCFKNNNNINNLINNNNINSYINYRNNINNLKSYDCFNNLNNQTNISNICSLNNINNNLLLAYYSQIQQKNLNNRMCNNMIFNQIFNPININVQFTNNNSNMEPSQDLKILNQINNRNNLFNNGFDDNVNILSHYLQIQNNPLIGINTFDNVNINNKLNQNDEMMNNRLENQFINEYNLMDIINNNINQSQIFNYINFINNNNNLNNNSSKNNNEKKKTTNEKNTNISNKRKVFNPLSESEKEKNIINLMDIFQCKDLRTTLMIKNIPNKYTISSFLEEINIYFKNTYDIFYLPIDYINKCNLGFAFINFVEPFHIILFYELYLGKKWKKFNSDKICELLYAKFQGRKELISHFEKGKVLSFESEEKRPLILPVPNPLPIINLPYYYLELFLKLYPHIPYKIKNFDNNRKDNNNSINIFSIKGNFLKKEK